MQCKICSQESHLLYKHLVDDRYGYPGTFEIYQCTVCGFAYSVPELIDDEFKKLYTDYYPRANISIEHVRRVATFRTGPFFLFKTWLQGTQNTCHYHIRSGERVLDVGCGDGASLLDITRAGGEAYGTEYDRNVEPIARKLGLRIFFGDLAQASYEDDFFDAITMSQLLEHIPNPIAFLRIAKQKLKPGGRIIMSFPNINSFNQKRSGRQWINWHVPYHLNFFTEKSIALLADAASLKLSSMRTFTPNQWLILQKLRNHYKPHEGKPSPVWITNASSHIWCRRFRVGIALLASIMRTPMTRLQDIMGHGDSYLVILKKSQ